MDANKRLLGILTISDLMEVSLSEPDAALTAGDLLRRDPIVAYPEETCREAAEGCRSGVDVASQGYFWTDMDAGVSR